MTILGRLMLGPVGVGLKPLAALDTNHWGVAAVLLLGAIQSGWMLWRKPRFRTSDPTSAATDDSGDRLRPSAAVRNVTHSYLVHPSTLASWRLLAFLVITAVSLHQLQHFPISRLVRFYTVWNFWLLGGYFLCAAATFALERACERRIDLPLPSGQEAAALARSHPVPAAGGPADMGGTVLAEQGKQQAEGRRGTPGTPRQASPAASDAPAPSYAEMVVRPSSTSTQLPSHGAPKPGASPAAASPGSGGTSKGSPAGSASSTCSPCPAAAEPSTAASSASSAPAAPAPGGEGWWEPRALRTLATLSTTLFHTNMTTSAIVTLVNWLVLYPMMVSGDPARAARSRALLCNFTGYMQHGGNLAMAVADLLLNAVPYELHLLGLVGAEALLYALAAFCVYAATGTWTYPFMDVSKPYAWAAYLGVYLLHWAVYLLFWGMYGVKMWALGRLERRHLLGVHSRHDDLGAKR